jgi:hypothetical protein
MRVSASSQPSTSFQESQEDYKFIFSVAVPACLFVCACTQTVVFPPVDFFRHNGSRYSQFLGRRKPRSAFFVPTHTREDVA